MGFRPFRPVRLHTFRREEARVGSKIELSTHLRLTVPPPRRFSFVPEIFVTRGLTCDAPGFGRLVQLVGRENACELLFTGDIIDASRAKEIGLTSRVVAPEDLMPTALDLARKIAANPPLAVQAIKKGLRETVDPPWREVGKMAITEIRRLMQSDDAKGSAAAFIEKRNPVFTGK